MRGRGGFTLTELVVATGLTVIVGGALYQLLLTTQRFARSQAAHQSLQSNLRAGALVITNELRELSPADLLTLGSGSLVYRAMRGFGIVCQPSTATQIRLTRAGYTGYRDPQPNRDSAQVFVEGNPDTDQDDLWLPFAITDVSTGTSCSGAAGPGITLTTPVNSALSGLPLGTPLKVSEIMELRLYRSDGKSWLGMRSVSSGEAIQPALGPLSDFDLAYLDGNGAPTSVPALVKSIRLTLRAMIESVDVTAGAVSPVEELATHVTLRNAPP